MAAVPIFGQIDWINYYGEPDPEIFPGGMVSVDDSLVLVVTAETHPLHRTFDVRTRTYNAQDVPVDSSWSDVFPDHELYPQQTVRSADGRLYVAAVRHPITEEVGPIDLVILERTGTGFETRLVHPFVAGRAPPRITQMLPRTDGNGWYVATVETERAFPGLETVRLVWFDAQGTSVWEKLFRTVPRGLARPEGLQTIVEQPSVERLYVTGEITTEQQGSHYLFDLNNRTGATRREWQISSDGSGDILGKRCTDIYQKPFTNRTYALLETDHNSSNWDVQLVELSDTTMEVTHHSFFLGQYGAFVKIPTDSTLSLVNVRNGFIYRYRCSAADEIQEVFTEALSWRPPHDAYRLLMPDRAYHFWRKSGQSSGLYWQRRSWSIGGSQWLRIVPYLGIHHESVFGVTATSDGYLLGITTFNKHDHANGVQLMRTDRVGNILGDTLLSGFFSYLDRTQPQYRAQMESVSSDTVRIQYAQNSSDPNITFRTRSKFVTYGFAEVNYPIPNTAETPRAEMLRISKNEWVRLVKENCCTEPTTLLVQHLNLRTETSRGRYFDGYAITDPANAHLYRDPATANIWLGVRTAHPDLETDSLHLFRLSADLHLDRELHVRWQHGPLPADYHGVEERNGGLYFIAAGLIVRPEGIFERTHPALPPASRGIRIGEDLYVVVGTQRRGTSDDFWMAQYRPVTTGRIPTPASAEQLSVQPNPTRGWVRYRVPASMKTTAEWSILDSNGRIWQRGHINAPTDRWQSLDVFDLPAGMYWLQLRSQEAHYTTPLVRIE